MGEQSGIKMAVTLADGSYREWIVAKAPRYWQSWVMRQMPSGTDYQGAQWSFRPVGTVTRANYPD
jgi:hypothetical protein